MSFNKEQLSAIEASTNEDILISAGAGSGKTKTLSVRVNKIINDLAISPSELLVLTFTNNAAHEMKERIVASFKNDNNDFANQILSSHVQTFDSFAQYLVTSYAARLGISDKISIILDEVVESKRRQYLDEILDEFYNDPIQFDRLKETIAKLSNRDDESMKKIILDLSSSLAKLPTYQRDELLDDYDNKYFTKEFFLNCLNELIVDEKRKVKKAFLSAYIIDHNYHLFMESDDPIKLKAAFAKDDIKGIDFTRLSFNEEHAQALYEGFRNIDTIAPFTFIKLCQGFRNVDLVSKKEKNIDEDSAFLFDNVYKPLLKLFKTNDALLIGIMSFDDEENDYQKYLSFKNDVHLLLDIVKELDKRVLDYKMLTNSFAFQDIQNMALSLVNDPKYGDIADEIRSRFKYIMVDEYQDTNDFQETFINSLLKEDKDGNRAHLFCVGDAKQAIYGFRGSNVGLFKNRQHSYDDGKDGHRVINMNKNYRSAKQLLHDINYIFSYYMTTSHGGIDYLNPLEQLQYDDAVDLYGKKPYDHFGIYRLIPMKYKDNAIAQKMDIFTDNKTWEINAIINDIKDKVSSGFMVYDRACKDHLRPAEYRDFVILTRTKTPFKDYQKAFNQSDIPLNIKMSSNLKEADAIILLQSLISLLSYKLLDEDIDVRHIFASIARSYAFQYSDDELYQLLMNPFLMENDPIMIRMHEFINKCEGQSFVNIFTMLLEEFDVINKLYLIGDVADNIAKIESFYSIVLNEQKAGEGLKDFLSLLKNVIKYDLSLKDESSVSIDNAVSLMTIHASKGLENKIVYMPVSFNKISTGNNFSKPDYYFSYEYGVQLPYYGIDLSKTFINDKGEEETIKSPIATIPYLRLANLNSIDLERDEHVRLFYVALTRAENCLYIVGEPIVDENKENLYGMLNYLPHYRSVNTNLINKASTVIKDIDPLYKRYQDYVKIKSSDTIPFTYEDIENEEKYLIFAEIYKELISNRIDKIIDNSINDIEHAIITYMHDSIVKYKDDLDYMASLQTKMSGVMWIDTFKQSLDAYLEISDEPSYLMEKSELEKTEEGMKEFLHNFSNAMVLGQADRFGLPLAGAKDDPIQHLYHLMFNRLLTAFFNESWLDKVSYHKEGIYEDKEEYYQYAELMPEETKTMLRLKPLNLATDDEEFIFQARVHSRASHMSTMHDEDIKDVLAFGSKMHRYMELVDFKTKDTSFIRNKYDKKIIDKVLALPLFNNLDGYHIYKEYGYFDYALNTTGFIDLLLQKDDEFIIVDYKLKNIDFDTYKDQLNTYRRNVSSIFKVNEKSIKVMLVSLLTGDIELEN